MADRPNILLILTDQQNFRMMSCVGNRYLSTPAMDSLAAEGVRFDRAYCANPVCIASRFGLMTGRMPSVIGMISNDTRRVQSIPDSIKKNGLGFRLREAGYDAAYAGKVHLPKMSAADIGFDYICQDERNELAEACRYFLMNKRERPFCLVASFINPHDICYMAIRDMAEDEAEKRLVAGGVVECATLDAALARPEGVDDDTFFAELCPPLPPNFEPQEDEPEAVEVMVKARPFRMKVRERWNENRWREHRWAYVRLTEKVDEQIGRVLDALHTSGHDRQTLVVFTSDHGDMDASHRMEHKSTLYDEACRIPLIVRPPGGMKEGCVDDAHLVSNGLDLLPTLCDWAGAAAPADIDGRSLRKLVEEGKEDTWRESIGVECAIGRGIVTDRFKYARYDLGSRNEQLIDLEHDPYEMRNAIHDAEHRAVVESLRTAFEEMFGAERRRAEEIFEAAAES